MVNQGILERLPMVFYNVALVLFMGIAMTYQRGMDFKIEKLFPSVGVYYNEKLKTISKLFFAWCADG